jgi:predicted secreted protein
VTADIGDLERIGNPSQATDSAAFTTLAGAATDPTAVTLVVLKPDGSKLHYGWPSAGADGTLVRESAGRFFYDVLIDQSGTWRFRLAGTGNVTAAAEGSLTVQRQRVLP